MAVIALVAACAAVIERTTPGLILGFLRLFDHGAAPWEEADRLAIMLVVGVLDLDRQRCLSGWVVTGLCPGQEITVDLHRDRAREQWVLDDHLYLRHMTTSLGSEEQMRYAFQIYIIPLIMLVVNVYSGVERAAVPCREPVRPT